MLADRTHKSSHCEWRRLKRPQNPKWRDPPHRARPEQWWHRNSDWCISSSEYSPGRRSRSMKLSDGSDIHPDYLHPRHKNLWGWPPTQPLWLRGQKDAEFAPANVSGRSKKTSDWHTCKLRVSSGLSWSRIELSLPGSGGSRKNSLQKPSVGSG